MRLPLKCFTSRTTLPKEAVGCKGGLLACHTGIIPKQKLFDPVLPVTVNDGVDHRGQTRLRIYGIEFPGFDERGNDCPILGSGVVPRGERVLLRAIGRMVSSTTVLSILIWPSVRSSFKLSLYLVM